MNYLVFKITHLTGLVLVFMGLAGVLAMGATGDVPFKKRWIFHLAHGLGLLLIIISGIAMVAQLGKLGDMHPLPGWVKAKFGIWLLAGFSMALVTRIYRHRFAGLKLVFFTALVIAAAWLAILKPF
jgi:hypothetical protein